MSDPLQFFAIAARRLRDHAEKHGDAAVQWRVSDLWKDQLSIHPRWKEEAPDSGTAEEYLIRVARAVGVNARYDPLTDILRCRLTENADDEAAIMWPGKRS